MLLSPGTVLGCHFSEAKSVQIHCYSKKLMKVVVYQFNFFKGPNQYEVCFQFFIFVYMHTCVFYFLLFCFASNKELKWEVQSALGRTMMS